MRSLRTKITLAIVGVTLITTLLTLVIVTDSTLNSFERFIEDRFQRTVEPLQTSSTPTAPSPQAQPPLSLSSNPPPPPPGLHDINWKNDRSPRRFQPDTPAGNFEDSVYRGVATGLGVGAALGLIVGILLTGQLVRPLRRLTEATRTLADGALGRQVPVTTQDEIGELTDAFNQMSRDLAQAEQLRQQMTADIAHDIRTPLTVIAGYAEGLNEGKVQESAQTYSALHQQVQYLSRLVDDLRMLSLVDAGTLPLNKRPTDPLALLERTAVSYIPKAEAQGVALLVTGQQDLPLAPVDVERMMQVLNNLVSNALRYTAPGQRIELRAAAAGNRVRLQVADTGRGIPGADLPYIFERFYRADSARTRTDTDSSGLGLAIVKAIVESHGGAISVTSVVDQGTTFTIDLPRSTAM